MLLTYSVCVELKRQTFFQKKKTVQPEQCILNSNIRVDLIGMK